MSRDAATARGRNPLTLAVWAAVWIATLANWPLWRSLRALPEMDSTRGWVFIAGFCGMVAALTLALLAFAAWRHTVKPAIALFVVSAALGAHFMGSYGVVIDPTMMTNVLQTNPRETLDLLSLRFFLSVLLLAGVPLILLWRVPVQRLRFAAQLGRNAIALFVVSAALGAHFMGSYGVVIDPTMMTNVLQTNPRETLDLLSLRFSLSVLLLAGVPLVLLWRVPVQRLRFAAQLGRNAIALLVSVLVLAALVMALFADLSATMRNHKSLRYLVNPVNSFYALGALAFQSQARPSGPPQVIGTDVRQLPRAGGALPPLLMLVVGETARADHFSLNGYARPTNPELAALPVTSFRDVTSCGTNTAASLPCMFSALGRVGYDTRERDQENLLDLAQRAGLAVLWLDNQAGCKGLCARVPNAFAREVPAGVPPLPAALCADGDCLDAALLHGLDERLAALPAEQRARGVLLVLHQMGSHGPAYYKRAPPERKPFMPECGTNVLQQCERQTLVNAYDNSIAYTDHVLASAIGWLKRQTAAHDPALLYVSDHGESLGENNLYLHGLPYAVAPREQKHVPMIVWFAPQTATDTGLDVACLAARRDAALSHDHLFHSVMGLLGLRSSEYRATLDAFAPCRPG